MKHTIYKLVEEEIELPDDFFQDEKTYSLKERLSYWQITCENQLNWTFAECKDIYKKIYDALEKGEKAPRIN